MLRLLRRRRWLIFACLLAGAGGALALSLVQTKQYSASASLLFRDPAFDQKLFGTAPLSSSSNPQRDVQTNVKLVSLPVVADRTAQALRTRLTGDEILAKISVGSPGQSDVVAITATDPSPRLAATIANEFSNQYIAFRRDSDRAKIRQAQALVQRQLSSDTAGGKQSPRDRLLADREDQLAILASLQTGNAELVQPAELPTSPSSPKTRRNTIAGGLLGLLIGLLMALLLERLDRRIKDTDDLEEAFGLPILGAIPKSRGLTGFRSGPRTPDPLAGEAFAMLRAKLRFFNVDRDIRRIMVTSAEPRDGKTTVSWHLATTAAMHGDARVILVEADLRRPTIASQYGLIPMPGLAELLTRDLDLEDVIQTAPVEAGTGAPAGELSVIVAGALPPNPAQLLDSHKMSSLIDRLSAEYDLVVIDTPPTAVVSDAMPLMARVGGVLVVGRLGKTSKDSARALHEQLVGMNAPTLGVVANDVEAGAGGYGYYGYGYDYPAAPYDMMPSPNGGYEPDEHVAGGNGADAASEPKSQRGLLRRR